MIDDARLLLDELHTERINYNEYLLLRGTLDDLEADLAKWKAKAEVLERGIKYSSLCELCRHNTKAVPVSSICDNCGYPYMNWELKEVITIEIRPDEVLCMLTFEPRLRKER